MRYLLIGLAAALIINIAFSAIYSLVRSRKSDNALSLSLPIEQGQSNYNDMDSTLRGNEGFSGDRKSVV